MTLPFLSGGTVDLEFDRGENWTWGLNRVLPTGNIREFCNWNGGL